MVNVTLFISFAAGFLAFFSPCILPIIPGYISYISGLSTKDIEMMDRGKIRLRIMAHSSFFILGFSVLFIILGATASAAGRFFFEYQPVIKKVGAIIVFIFGMYLLGIIRIKVLNNQYRLFDFHKKTISYTGSFIVGLTFSAGWTACVGPVLASILIMAGSSASIGTGVLYLLAFSAGLAIPFLLVGFFLSEVMDRFSKYTKHMRGVEIFSGMVLLGAGLYLFFF
ncbi:MAG: cytochrome c biogenesis protein CcdA [Candidatus Margulisiibacteriota bacterium]